MLAGFTGVLQVDGYSVYKTLAGKRSVILADGVNLGLRKMAEACKAYSFWELLRVADWHVREETYERALAMLIEAQRALSFARLWGMGETSSSDGQHFPAGGTGEVMNVVNARYGTAPGASFYTHLTDQYGRNRLLKARGVLLGGLGSASCSIGAVGADEFAQVFDAEVGESDAEAAGRIARIRRWLSNPRVDSQVLYRPIIAHVLAAWRNREVTIMLDGCCVNHEKLQFFQVALSHCYRALPLAWQVVDHSGGVAVAACRPMLDQVQQLLIGTRRVTFLADRGFRDWEWAATCRARDWDYIIRIANTTTIRWDRGPFIALDAMGIQPGKPRYLANVQLTQRGHWRCNIAITWTRATKTCPAELCAVMTNREPTKWILSHYLRRMHIEECFRDDKSGGFDLDASHLRDAQRLDRLLLAIAVATLWIYELGERLLGDDRRGEIDPGYRRQLSVFQLGWRWLRRALSLADLPEWKLCLHPFRPERVTAKC